ncbi:MAG: glycosyltransferase [Elusimicrobia bacterium]|nr:glycosyltransferase [Elusimicrobiota bacterium]
MNQLNPKKILILYSRLPWPLISGDRMRVYYMSKILAKKYKVDLVCISEGNGKTDIPPTLKELFNHIQIFYFSKARSSLNAALGLFSNKPLQVHYYYFKPIQNWINLNYKNYAWIFCNHIRMSDYVKRTPIKKIIDFHDALSENYSQARYYSSGLWKHIYRIEKNRVAKYESEMLERFDLGIVTSQSDKNALEKIDKNHLRKIDVIPMGIKEELVHRNQVVAEENLISFLGKLDYPPNEDAVLFFAKQVFPLIKKNLESIGFYILGYSPTRKILSLGKEVGIKIIGYSEDPYTYIEKSKIVVAPVRYGTGIQNKILESMCLGKTVITTPIGASGIPNAINGEHLIINDFQNPETASKQIINLIIQKEMRDQIGKNARKLILENYTWELIGNRLLSLLNEP